MCYSRVQEYGSGHPHIATALAHMSEALRLQGRVEEAAATAARALGSAEEAYGSMAPAVAEVLLTLGDLQAAQGGMAAAEASLRRCVEGCVGPRGWWWWQSGVRCGCVCSALTVGCSQEVGGCDWWAVDASAPYGGALYVLR